MLSSPIFQKYPQGRRLINLSNLTNYEFSGEENAEVGFNFVSFLNRKKILGTYSRDTCAHERDCLPANDDCFQLSVRIISNFI